MESLKLSFQAIMPIFLLMLLGYMIRRLNIADKKSLDTITKLVFKIFLPVLLFYNIYRTETDRLFDFKLIAFAIAGILCTFILGYIAVMVLSKDNAKRGVMLQGFFRANFAILGIPLVNYICGEEAGGLTSLMVAVVVPAFNFLAVIALERFRNNGGKVSIPVLLKNICTNPLIVGCIIGVVFLVLDIKLPFVIEEAVADVSSVATPLSIITLGAAFSFTAIKGYLKEIVTVVSARLVIVPLIIIPVAVWFGFSGEALACLLITFGAPVAVSSFAMAQQMGGDEKLAAQLVAISSVFCLATLFLWIFALSYLGLF